MFVESMASTAILNGSSIAKANLTLPVALAVALTLVICKTSERLYVEFPTGEPMANVLALIRWAEVEHHAAFDLEDPDLWEPIGGGMRIHGMFRDSLNREE